MISRSGALAPQHTRTRRRSRFRPDIEGLRAIAVLGVVLYHAHVGVLQGGFVGVDVFFVVSGYLITGLLWRELDKDRRISLGTFYGRRARRLLPASILVIVITAIAARHWLPPLQVDPVMKDGVSSALYVGNYRFGFTQTSYLNATAPPSPFQHYWSLGVEEQFYLVWPLLLIGASWLGRRTRSPRDSQPSRWSAGAVLAAVTAGSFVLSLWLTHANQPWAFFSLPTRAWELGAGGVLALAASFVGRLPRPSAVALGWAGLAVVIGSMFVIGASTPFPGSAALAPVVGTLAVLAAGESAAEMGPIWVLGRPPMRLVGRISYSWYLWHWPFLTLAPYALGHALGLGANLMVAALSGLVATASFLLVETPARTSAWLSALPRRSLVSGATLTAGGAATCVILALTVPSLTGHGVARVAKIEAPGTTVRVPARGGPPATVDPAQARIDSINGQINAQVTASVGIRQVPSNLQPTISAAAADAPGVFYDGCMDSYLDATVRDCAFGDVASATSVVLFGDSHAAMWFPAVDDAANQHGWKLLNLTKATCPPIEIPIFSPVLGRNFTECDTWRQAVLARIQADHPALVILAVARHYTSIYGFTPYQQPWLQGLAQMVSTIRRLGSKVMVIGPIPKPPALVPDCLSAHLGDAAACTVPLSQGVDAAGMAAERAVVTSAGGSYVDTLPWFCTAQTCAVIVGNLEVWRDDNHITAVYSNFLGPAMSAEMAAVMGGS
jgi:peptidoglycan/LPS O-acetylase OafA/YrhL